MQYRQPVFTTITCAIALALSSGMMSAHAQTPAAADEPDQMFPNAKAGECYARAFIPPTYTTETTEVVKRAASATIKVIPAKFETVDETVVVKAASKRLEIVPAEFEWKEEEVIVRPASKKLVTVPATYEEVTEKVLVHAAYTTWKKGVSPAMVAAAGPGGTRVSSSGEVLCLVEVPAVYKTVTQRKVTTPASTREEEVPAVTKTIRRQVVKTPPSTREVDIPEVTKVIKVNKEVEPAREVRTEIPEEKETVTSTKQVTEGRYEWRSILCETNATKDKIKAIQSALKSAGFDPGPIDGVLARQTMRAVNAYQKDKQLPVDPYLNMDTVKSLGVSL